jgi:hypothetical protein
VADLGAAHQSHLHAHAAAAVERGKRWARTRECLLSACALAAADPAGCRLVAATGREVVPVAAALLRDTFGDRFRPVAFSPEWRTDTALSLVRQIYDSRDFGAMPILADALQDAGCDNGNILNHCRGPGPHVRGCWVLDLVLGKE